MTRRLLLGYLSVTVFVLLLLEIPLAIFFQQRETDRLSADAERDATVLASIYEDALEGGAEPDPVPAARYRADTGARVVVVDNDGIAVVDTDADLGRDLSTRPEIAIALTGRRDVGTRFSTTLGTELFYVAVPIASGGTVHGALRVTVDAREVNERVQRFWLGLAAVAVVVLAAVAAVGWTVARSVARPIRSLQGTAARFAAGDLNIAEPTPGAPNEIRDLEVAMNTMAQRLDRLIGEQRAFVADASHQLRTPLTALRLRLDNLHATVADTPVTDAAGAPGADAHELEAAIAEIDRLGDLVAGLLALARAEQEPTLTAADVSSLVRDRVDTWSAMAEHAGVDLSAAGAQVAHWVAFVPGGLEQVLDNLIDNAITATASTGGGNVIVALGQTVGIDHRPRVVLTVTDTGPGLDDDGRRHALDRFWRGDTSQPGTGLGLAIVDRIVASSGGRLELADATPHGLSARVELGASCQGVTAPVEDRFAQDADHR